MRLCAIGCVLIVTALTITASFQPWNPLLRLVTRLPGGDTTAHFLFLGCTAYASTLAFTRPARHFRWTQLLPAILLLLAATGDELSQLGIRTRTFSLGDLAANYAGIGLFTPLALGWQRRRGKRPEEETPRPPA